MTAALLALPAAQALIANRGYDSNRFAWPCASVAVPRGKTEHPYDKALYSQRHHIENMIGRRRKDWRRIATR
jgi:hypothetical protein